MSWQCPRDGSTNVEERCAVCGGLPFEHAPMLMDDSGRVVIQLFSGSRIMGSDDWPDELAGADLSRLHARVFFDAPTGRWYVANVSRGHRVAVNGEAVAQSQRKCLRDGDVLHLGAAVRLRVAMREMSSDA